MEKGWVIKRGFEMLSLLLSFIPTFFLLLSIFWFSMEYIRRHTSNTVMCSRRRPYHWVGIIPNISWKIHKYLLREAEMWEKTNLFTETFKNHATSDHWNILNYRMEGGQLRVADTASHYTLCNHSGKTNNNQFARMQA